MSFGVIQITNKGRALQAKALTGVQLNFTRIAVGDGQLSGQVIAELNGLINEVESIALNTLKVLPGGKAKVGGVLSNQNLHNGFYWRELGVFADDPDLGEILYCYGNAGALAEYIPGPNGSEILERQINVITIVGDAPNISAIIDQSLVFATREDINEAISNHEQKVNPHGITAEKIGAETPDGAQEKADQAEANAKAYANSVAEQAETNAKEYTNQAVGALAGEGNTKTVKQLEDELAAHKAESVTHKVSNRKPTATDDETQNIKQGDIWIYENYINEEEYEFIAYQCMDNKAGIAKWEKYVEKVAVPQKIYGVEIDENNSNPETAVVYTDDAVGFTPARGNDGNFDWGSWENIIKDEFKIRPCVLRNPQGTVNYYLDYDDFTKKSDGTTANLTGADGDVMIEFGQELWYKFTRIGSKLKIQLSTKPFDGAIKPAFEIEDGYNLVPFYPLTLTQIIYVLMFKNLDSQTALGKGRTDADSYTNTGTTNKKTFCYGSTDATDNMKFLGMEDYFGNRRWWIDGCFYDNNRNMLIGKGNFNDEGNGYTNYGQATPSDGGGYIDKIQGQNETGFIPASISGSATTFYCDYGYVYAGRLPNFGGIRSNASNAGTFSLTSDAASGSSANLGGRLFYSQNGKIYIGAYLGVEQNGKLRSISGYESANSKTIGEFRNLARANND